VLKAHQKKHFIPVDPQSDPEFIIKEAKNFLNTLEALRSEIIARDAAYLAAKTNKNSAEMTHYRELAQAISKKCLDYGRDLCNAPIPHWVDGNLSKDHIEITRHAYDVIRNKICASLNVFDSDLMPNAKLLLDFSQGKF
jgi:hypothetical protein